MRYVFILLVLLAAPARAQTSLAPLASQNFDGIRRGVEALAVSGDSRAATVLGALQSGTLVVAPDGTLFIKENSGALTHAASGEPALSGVEGP